MSLFEGVDALQLRPQRDFLPGFMARFNERFATPAADRQDMHRPLNMPPDRLADVLCWREQRYVGQQLAFSYQRKRIILDETDLTRGLAGKYVDTYAFADGGRPAYPALTRTRVIVDKSASPAAKSPQPLHRVSPMQHGVERMRAVEQKLSLLALFPVLLSNPPVLLPNPG